MKENNRKFSDINPDDIEKLIADTNPDFPLSEVNAIAALAGPTGSTVAQVAGRSVYGADITFQLPDNTLFHREVKCITGGRNAFNRRISDAISQFQDEESIGDIFIQVRKNYDVQGALAYFIMRRQNQPKELDKYRGVRLQARDETGIVLFDDVILEEQQ